MKYICFYNLFKHRGRETKKLLRGGVEEKRLRTTDLKCFQ